MFTAAWVTAPHGNACLHALHKSVPPHGDTSYCHFDSEPRAVAHRGPGGAQCFSMQSVCHLAKVRNAVQHRRSNVEVSLLGGGSHFFKLLEDPCVVLLQVALQGSDAGGVYVEHLQAQRTTSLPPYCKLNMGGKVLPRRHTTTAELSGRGTTERRDKKTAVLQLVRGLQQTPG